MWWRDEYGGTVVRDGGGSTRAVVGFVFVLMVVAFVFGFSVAGSEALNPGLTELRLEQAAAVRAQAEADAAESARYTAVAVEAARVRKADNEVLRVRAVEAGLGAAAAVVALIGAAVAYRVACLLYTSDAADE